MVLALLAVQQGFFAVNQPTRSAIIPRIVPVDMVPAANALSMTVFSLGVIVGPLLVGMLIPLVGLPWLYFIDALTLVAILYAVIKLPPIPPLGERRGPGQGAATGWPTCGSQPLLLMTFVVDIIAMVFGMPRALFPQMAQETFGGPPGGGLALGMLNAPRSRCGRGSARRLPRPLRPSPIPPRSRPRCDRAAASPRAFRAPGTRRFARERGREGGEHAVAHLDQQHPPVAVDLVELLAQGVARQLGDLTGHLDPVPRPAPTTTKVSRARRRSRQRSSSACSKAPSSRARSSSALSSDFTSAT